MDNRQMTDVGEQMTENIEVGPPWPPARRSYASESAT